MPQAQILAHPPLTILLRPIILRNPALLFWAVLLNPPGAIATPTTNGIADLPAHSNPPPPMISHTPFHRRPQQSSPAEESALSSSSSTPSRFLRCPKSSTCYSAALLHPSVDTRAFLNSICTPSSLLWNPRYTAQQRPSFTPPLRTSSSPAVRRTPVIVPDNLGPGDNIEEMDKRHPSSFQQLEKLGEGTYATV